MKTKIDYKNAHTTITNLCKEIAELEAVLQTYASPDEWTNVVHCQGENVDGSEWEFEYYLDAEKVFMREEAGYLLAQITLTQIQG